MANSTTASATPPAPAPVFATTRWSVVLAAGQLNDSQAQAALAHLCQTYWYPLYAYVRRHGHSPHDAQDLTQEFFARLLAGNWLARADQQRGRFRSFLLTALKHFLTNEWHRTHAQKRGGTQPILSLNDDRAEERYQLEPVEKSTPESLYERGWALSLLAGVLQQMEQEYAREGKAAWLETMRPALTAEPTEVSYPEIAEKLGLTETAARVAVHRLRQRYRKLIRAEIAHTVHSPAEIDEELHHLLQVLSQ